jgi:hypothetical protein
MKKTRIAAAFCLAFVLMPSATTAEPLPTITEHVEGFDRLEGLLTLYVDHDRGHVWLELPAPGGDGVYGTYLYVEGLRTGLGSNPVGLDRGQLGRARIVSFRRVGGRVLLEQPNLAFRAVTDRDVERRAVHESFARSVLWGGEIAATGEDGSVLVDWTPFVVRDAHDSRSTLSRTEQGSFQLDPDRSAVDLDALRVFPDNVELEAVLTLESDDPGGHVGSVAPDPSAVTLTQHQSLLRLPDDGFRRRRFHPRCGSFEIGYLDYAADVDASMDARWIVRHRLRRADPDAKSSPAVEPIVYHVDRAIPEPIRGAVLDGARWWAGAFEAAGYENAFRVELLPEGADPLDARYHVIQWVHRSTRGWSYGGGVVDPRSGEMVKAHVSLGSLRVRQDRLLFEGLLGADDPRAVELALARIRQLSAHEVGHTLGFSHNFAASTYDGRASVMDYPAPLIRVGEDDRFDLSDAYGVGVGSWDVQAARYAYSDYPDGTDVAAALASIVREATDRGLLFIGDDDARPAGAAHPLANLWDNGDDPVTALADSLRVRALALERFDATRVATGESLARLEEVLAPVYFHHRYQLEAAVKVVGGRIYEYAVRGDDEPTMQPTDGDWQRAALREILRIVRPSTLDLPEPVLQIVLPRAPGVPVGREMFRGQARPAFDPLAAAATAARQAIDGLLQRERAVRLVDQHRRDPDLPGLDEVVGALIAETFENNPDDPRLTEIADVVRAEVVDGLISLASDPAAPSVVTARAEDGLRRIADHLPATSALDGVVRRFLERSGPDSKQRPAAPEAPPGSPIGDDSRPRDRLSLRPAPR